ncbi:MAG: hypothetical protein IPI67_06795 [Myxococcales bacterium]|nr:hypothetical protein [Myxococcales bacterium]
MKLRAWLPVITAVMIAIPALVIVVNLHWFFLKNASYVGFDDGYTVALAERIIDGQWLPYVDGCSHRGPVLYWLVAVAQKLSGRFNWIGPRSLMLATSIITLFTIVGTGMAARVPLAGAVGALLWVYLGLVAHEADSAFAVTGEAIAAAFGLLALFFLAWGLIRATRYRNRVLLVALSGAATAMAGFTKQTAFPIAAPLFVWVFCSALSMEGLARRQRIGLLGAYIGGLLAIVVIVLGRYAIGGHLKTFWYWFYTYNREVYMAPMRAVPFRDDFDRWAKGQHWAAFAIALAASWGLARPLAEVRSFRDLPGGYARAGLEVTTSALVLVVFAAIASPQRFWPPYFIMVFPFLAMALGLQIGLAMDRSDGHPWSRAAGALLLGAVLCGWVGYTARNRVKELVADYKSEKRRPALPEPVCEMINQYGNKDDSLFVWGFDADYYITCKRHPAARFTYLTLVAGTVPPAWNDIRPEREARNARRDLMHDLQVSKPSVVLNSPGTMHDVGIHTVPALSEWLKRDYCALAPVTSKTGRHADVWVRRDLTTCTHGE